MSTNLDTSQAGIYEVIYIAYDKRGNSEIISQIVEVKDINSNDNNDYTYLIILTIIYVISIVVIYIKDKISKKIYFDNKQ